MKTVSYLSRKSHARKPIGLSGFIQTLRGAKRLRPVPISKVDMKLKKISTERPLHVSAINEPSAIKLVNVPVMKRGKKINFPVLFGSDYKFHDARREYDHIRLFAERKWWIADVFWPVSRALETVQWNSGLHERITEAMIQKAHEFRSKITLLTSSGQACINDWRDILALKRGQPEMEFDEILSIVSLGAVKGTKVVIEAKGPDARKAKHAISNLFHERRKGW